MAILADTNSYLVYGEESVYGTPPTNVNSFLGVPVSFNPVMTNNLNVEHGIGYGLNAQGIYATLFDVSLTTTIKILNGSIFKYILGSKTGSGTSSDPYVYTINTLPSITLESGFNLGTDQVIRMTGSYVKTANLKISVGQPITIDLTFVGKTIAKSNTYQSLSAPSGDIYYFQEGWVEINSTKVAEIEDVGVNIDTGIIKSSEIGSRISTQNQGVFTITGNMTARITNGDYIEWALGGASSPSSTTPSPKTSIVLKMTNGDTKYIYITLSNVYLNNWRLNASSKQLVKESLDFNAKSISVSEVV